MEQSNIDLHDEDSSSGLMPREREGFEFERFGFQLEV